MNAKIQILPIMVTPFVCGEVIQTVISELQSLAFRLLKQFENNQMKANPGKPHIFLSNKKTEKVTICDVVLTSNFEEKFLGITLDSELKIEKYITGICGKASQKNTCSVQNYKLHVVE